MPKTPLLHGVLLDTITRWRQSVTVKEGPYGFQEITREEALGMTFDRGEPVVDTITGQGGEIIAGTRASVAKD